MKRIFSIIMEQGLGLPTGTIAFWGTLVPRILTVDYTFNKHPSQIIFTPRVYCLHAFQDSVLSENYSDLTKRRLTIICKYC